MATGNISEIKDSLRELYLADPRPWLVGFQDGKDSTLVASLIFDTVLSIPDEQRKKEIAIVCTDTRVEIPAIVEMIETTLAKMRKCSAEQNLNIEVNLLRPPAEQSFWVNIIGRGYPPPNRVFRWCTQRLKIDPGHPLRRIANRQVEGSHSAFGRTAGGKCLRAQTLAARETRNGLTRHPDMARVWVSNPIQFLTTEEDVGPLAPVPAPAWGGSNRDLYKLYNAAGGGECPVQIDTSTPACGNSRFGCWTCTVVERDKASEGLLASGDERMEHLVDFRDTLIEYRDPANGKRDERRMNGNDGPGPLNITARRELLDRLLKLQEETGLKLIAEEAFLIQQLWNTARKPDDGGGVARIVSRQKGIVMSNWKETNRLRELQEEIAKEKDIRGDTLRRLLAKVEEFSESHRAFGLPDDLLNILKDDLVESQRN